MASNRYGDQSRREPRRDSSIFSDDDRRRETGRWSGEPSRAGDDDRGFFERAGDEVRSWFGDEEAERRRERDIQREDARSAFSGFEGRESRRDLYSSGSRGTGSSSEPSWGRRERVYGGSQSRESSLGVRSQWDDNYRQWRDRQIEQFDREYDDYCRERQQDFEKEFDSWRTSRLTQGGSPTGAGGRQGRGQTMEGGSAQTTTTRASATGAASGSGETTGAAARGRTGRSGT